MLVELLFGREGQRLQSPRVAAMIYHHLFPLLGKALPPSMCCSHFDGARGPSGDPVRRIGVLFAGAGCSYVMVRLLLVPRALPLDLFFVLLETCGARSQRDHDTLSGALIPVSGAYHENTGRAYTIQNHVRETERLGWARAAAADVASAESYIGWS